MIKEIEMLLCTFFCACFYEVIVSTHIFKDADDLKLIKTYQIVAYNAKINQIIHADCVFVLPIHFLTKGQVLVSHSWCWSASSTGSSAAVWLTFLSPNASAVIVYLSSCRDWVAQTRCRTKDLDLCEAVMPGGDGFGWAFFFFSNCRSQARMMGHVTMTTSKRRGRGGLARWSGNLTVIWDEERLNRFELLTTWNIYGETVQKKDIKVKITQFYSWT